MLISGPESTWGASVTPQQSSGGFYKSYIMSWWQIWPRTLYFIGFFGGWINLRSIFFNLVKYLETQDQPDPSCLWRPGPTPIMSRPGSRLSSLRKALPCVLSLCNQHLQQESSSLTWDHCFIWHSEPHWFSSFLCGDSQLHKTTTFFLVELGFHSSDL